MAELPQSPDAAVFQFIDQERNEEKKVRHLEALHIVTQALANEAGIPSEDHPKLEESKRQILDQLAMMGLKAVDLEEIAA